MSFLRYVLLIFVSEIVRARLRSAREHVVLRVGAPQRHPARPTATKKRPERKDDFYGQPGTGTIMFSDTR